MNVVVARDRCPCTEPSAVCSGEMPFRIMATIDIFLAMTAAIVVTLFTGYTLTGHSPQRTDRR